MNIFFLTLYIMLWTLGICASYAFVMTVTKKDASVIFLRRSSLLALLSYGASWFFGVLYYIHPDTVARFAKALPPSTNAWLHSIFAQSRECLFFSFILVPILAAWLACMIFFVTGPDGFSKKKSDMVHLSIILTILGTLAILSAMMIA